jgi:hypothetical protein
MSLPFFKLVKHLWKIKMLHFANGHGEFTSRAFNAFCELHGITIYKFLLPTTKWNFRTKK